MVEHSLRAGYHPGTEKESDLAIIEVLVALAAVTIVIRQFGLDERPAALRTDAENVGGINDAGFILATIPVVLVFTRSHFPCDFFGLRLALCNDAVETAAEVIMHIHGITFLFHNLNIID